MSNPEDMSDIFRGSNGRHVRKPDARVEQPARGKHEAVKGSSESLPELYTEPSPLNPPLNRLDIAKPASIESHFNANSVNPSGAPKGDREKLRLRVSRLGDYSD